MRLPTAGTPYRPAEVSRAILGLFESKTVIRTFQEQLKKYLTVKNLALVNSGTTACYLLLDFFKKIRADSRRDEVILPAYTAPSLLLPIRAANLKPVLVDIDPQTFNLAIDRVSDAITPRTLAIMPVHMFGLPCEVEPLIKLTDAADIFLFEDAASSLGTRLHGKMSGTVAPFGFYSLNRGKNISTLTGGIITWQDARCNDLMDKLVNTLPPVSFVAQKIITLKIIGLSFAVKPLFYTLLTPLIAKYKYTTLHTHFESFAYTPTQAALGKALWRCANILTARRIINGKILLKIFRNHSEFIIPLVKPEWEVAFNQFPLIVKDLSLRAELQRRLLTAGIETSLLYERPLHHIFPELNPTGGEPFPQATYLAEHLLLIPTHAQVRQSHLAIIQDIINSLC